MPTWHNPLLLPLDAQSELLSIPDQRRSMRRPRMRKFFVFYYRILALAIGLVGCPAVPLSSPESRDTRQLHIMVAVLHLWLMVSASVEVVLMEHVGPMFLPPELPMARRMRGVCSFAPGFIYSILVSLAVVSGTLVWPAVFLGGPVVGCLLAALMAGPLWRPGATRESSNFPACFVNAVRGVAGRVGVHPAVVLACVGAAFLLTFLTNATISGIPEIVVAADAA
jgi:hypothetical protein